MAEAKFDVLTIGNAIVDVLAQTEEDFLVREGLVKGAMRLIDGKEADRLFDHMGTTQLVSGGCAGNTAAGVASYGGRAAFIGKVADDELGKFFRHDMHALGIHFPTAPLSDGTPTARSMILVTPDSERTMNTYLAACQELSPSDIDRPTVEGAAITYLEGYLWIRPRRRRRSDRGEACARGEAQGCDHAFRFLLRRPFSRRVH
jgi:adenosine kinase